MKKLWICFVLAAFCLTSFGQVMQNGIVKEYRGTKAAKPLGNVTIVIEKAGSNASNNDGTFILEFRDSKYGEKVSVKKIEKDEYEPFNKDALENWHIASDGSVFVVKMCKSKDFKKLKDQYNAVSSKSYADQQAREMAIVAQQLQEGKIQQAEYEKQLEELKEYYDEQLENLDSYIDKFARIDLSELKDDEVKIIKMVQNGMIDKAIEAYENMGLVEKYAQASEDIADMNDAVDKLETKIQDEFQQRKQIFASIERQIQLVKLQGGKDNFDNVLGVLKQVCDADTSQFVPLSMYIDMALEQNKLDECICYARKMMIQAHELHVDSLEAKAYSRMGRAYSLLKEHDLAIENENKAIAIFETLDSTDIRIKRSLSSCYNTKGYTFSQCGLYGQAVEPLLKSYNLRCAVYNESQNEKDADDLHSTLFNLTNTFSALGDLSTAQLYSDKMMEYAQTVYEKGSEKSMERMAGAYVAKAFVYLAAHETSKQIDAWKSAEEYFKALYEYNPDKYEYDYLAALNNVADSYRQSGDTQSALQYASKVVDHKRELLKKNPTLRERDGLVTSLQMLGNIYSSSDDYNSAEACYLEAGQILDDFLQENKISYLRSKQKNSSRLAECYQKMEEYEKSEQCYQLSIQMAENLVAIDSASYTPALLNAQVYLADLYIEMKEYSKCDELLNPCIKLAEHLYQQSAKVYRPSLTVAYLSAYKSFRIQSKNLAALEYVDKLLILFPGEETITKWRENLLEEMDESGQR